MVCVHIFEGRVLAAGGLESSIVTGDGLEGAIDDGRIGFRDDDDDL